MTVTDDPTARTPGAPRPRGPGVLERSVAILDAVEDGATSFTQLVAATGYARPTVHRLIKELERQGLLAFYGGGYHFGPRLLRLAATAMRELPLRDLAHPIIERLSATTGESAQLYVRSADGRVCIDAVQSESELRTIVHIGATLPITAGSAGKVFLAWMPEPLRSRTIASARPVTDRTPIGEDLERQLDMVVRRGWAASQGEREAGVASVSAPVFDAHGLVQAAVSLSGPATRLARARAKQYAPAVTAAARDIERVLGTA